MTELADARPHRAGQVEDLLGREATSRSSASPSSASTTRRPTPTSTSRAAATRSSSNNIPASYLPFLTGTGENPDRFKDFTLGPYLGIYFYLINTKKFTNVHFRRALNFAVDRSQLPFITRGGELPTRAVHAGHADLRRSRDEELALCGVTRDTPGVAAIVEKGKLCYVPPPGLDFDLARAKRGARAGAEGDGREVPEALHHQVQLAASRATSSSPSTCSTSGRPSSASRSTLESQEWKTFLKDTVNGEYDVARMGWIGNFPDPEAEFLGNFKCTSPDNRTSFCSAEVRRADGAGGGRPSTARSGCAIVREAERGDDRAARRSSRSTSTPRSTCRSRTCATWRSTSSTRSPFRRVWIDPDWKRAAQPQSAP